MTIEQVRSAFPILQRRNYLNSCSLGALSDRAEERLRDFVAEWHDYGASAWYEHWWGLLGELRGRIETLFAAPAGTVALMPSTSACLAAISSSLDWAERNRIITTELDFPTLLYQWKVRPDAEMVVLRSPDGVHIDPQQFADAVDDRTLAIATSHVFFTTGAIQDLAAIADIARRAGAYSLIDGYQGAGQVPVDLPATGVDFYTAGPLKWLCAARPPISTARQLIQPAPTRAGCSQDQLDSTRDPLPATPRASTGTLRWRAHGLRRQDRRRVG